MIALLFSSIPLWAGGDEVVHDPVYEQFKIDSELAFKELGSQLKNALLTAISTGGPVDAISVCQHEAPALAARVSTSRDMEIGRTSLRLRNPANQPNAWEQEVLMEFERLLAAGVPPNELVRSARLEENGTIIYRQMRAIVTGDVCLMCHGPSEQLMPDLKAKLAELYPQDRAVNFQSGDLRGAFTAQSVHQK